MGANLITVCLEILEIVMAQVLATPLTYQLVPWSLQQVEQMLLATVTQFVCDAQIVIKQCLLMAGLYNSHKLTALQP